MKWSEESQLRNKEILRYAQDDKYTKLSSFRKTAYLSFFGQALNNTSERSEESQLRNKEILRYAKDDIIRFSSKKVWENLEF